MITASDPQGYALTVTGAAGSAPISCNGNCSVALPVGSGVATYTVTAATSGMNASGSTSWSYDSELPTPGINISGTSGTGGWYVSSVNISATGTDAISGIAGASITVDGGAEQSSATLNDGIHTIIASAIDNAGNTAANAPVTISVDTITPAINTSAAGTPGASGWYVSDVQVSATASDSLSGLDTLEATIDGGAWTAYSAPLSLTEGQHTVQFRATDKAGNVTTTASQSFQVDTTAPVITPTLSGSSGSNGWHISTTQISATASDSLSGLNSLEVMIDGGAWTVYSAPLSFATGKHTVQFRATDKAGNVSQITQAVAVDTSGPVVDLPAEWTLGKTISYKATDNESGLASLRVVIEDEKERFKKVVWQEGVSGNTFNGEINWDGRFADGTVAPPGTYLVWVKTADNAGNETFQLGKVTVEDSIFNWFIPPSKTPTPTTTPTLPPTAQATKQAVLAPAPTKPAIVVSSSAFGGKSQTGTIPASSQNNLPLVSAAVAAMAAAAAYALQRKREEDEAAKEEQEAKMRAKARAKAEAEWDRASAKKNIQPRGRKLDDVTEAERLAAYKQTDRYKNYQVSMQAWEQKKKDEQLHAYDDVENIRAGRVDTSSQASTPKPWWVSSSLEKTARSLVQIIPSAKVGSWRNPVPIFSFVSPEHAISFGTVTSGMLASNANPNLLLNSDGMLTPSVGRQPIASLIPRADGFDFNVRNPWQRYNFVDGSIKATLSSSVTARVTWGGFWNTTVGVDVNSLEVQVNGAGVKGRVSNGWYLEYKPGRIVTYALAAQIVMVGAIAVSLYILQTGDTTVLKPIFQR